MDGGFVFLVAIFVGSGVMQPLLISTLGYNGAYDRSTLLFLLPNYVGMTLAAFLRGDVFSTGTFPKRRLAVLSVIDVISQFLCQYGLTLAGSSLYIVIYSSCTIWIALEARLLLNRRLAVAQWAGCTIVVAGLAITGGNIASTLGDKSGAEIALGACMILCGSVSHALTWVLVEQVLTEPDPVLPEAVSAITTTTRVSAHHRLPSAMSLTTCLTSTLPHLHFASSPLCLTSTLPHLHRAQPRPHLHCTTSTVRYTPPPLCLLLLTAPPLTR